MEATIINFLSDNSTLGLFAVFFIMFFEGDIALFTAAFLSHRGIFSLSDVLLVTFAGMLIGDILWYWFGKNDHHENIFLTRWADKLACKFDKYIEGRFLYTILITKFAYGLHHAIIMRAGARKKDFISFLRADIAATIIWMATVGTLGYFSGYSFDIARQYLKYGELAVLGLLIILLVIEYLVAKKAASSFSLQI